MLSVAVIVSITLYILPIAAVLVARSSRSIPVWRIATIVPAVVATDMLAVMTLARFVRLETAILLSRPMWTLGALGSIVWRWRIRRERPRWPRGIGVAQILGTATAAIMAFEMSTWLSRPYHLWDRHWHIPLVTLFRAERIPFDNAYDPGHALHYHLTGDVLGSMFQTLSLGIANSSLALSVAHDVMFALIGTSIALLLFGFGFTRVWPAPLAALAVLLQGPASMRGKLGSDFYGYSFDNLLLVGFRPHVALAGLLLVGVVACVAVRLRRNDVPSIDTVPLLFVCCSLLAVTDEASMGIVGLALGITWCVAPQAVARSRLGGIAVLVTLGLTACAAQLVFSGSLSPGGPVQSVQWVPARSPGSQAVAPLSLQSSAGREALFFDLLPMLGCLVGFTLAAWKRPRATGALVFVWAVLAISLVLFTRLEVNQSHAEAQRFMIAPSFVVLVFALLVVVRTPIGSLASTAVASGLALAAFSTLSWFRQRGTDCENERVVQHHPNWHTMDCRESTGARLGDVASVAYIDHAIFGAYAGCRPSYAAGGFDPQWGIKVFPHVDSLPQLEQLGREMVPPDRDLVAICATPPSSDAVCTEAEHLGLCAAQGTDTRRCLLKPPERQAILVRLRGR